MRYISLCSGIEAASVAWEPLGWEPVAFFEISRYSSRLLRHHYPEVPNLGDITKMDWRRLAGRADVCVGGTPCQSFSMAGSRQSLSDPRGNLTLEFVNAVNTVKPRYVVWENVPGVLSTKDNAFGCFLGGLAGASQPLSYPAKRGSWPGSGVVDGPLRSVAWRTLDAQYFGVAQSRKRVFVVASDRDATHPFQILFEPEDVQRYSAPSRGEEEEIAGTLTSGASRGPAEACAGMILPYISNAEGGSGITLTKKNIGNHLNNQTPLLYGSTAVRRLTPLECERLQGFPDNYTNIPGCADAQRYKAIGDSMAVPVMRWIGERIAASLAP